MLSLCQLEIGGHISLSIFLLIPAQAVRPNLFWDQLIYDLHWTFFHSIFFWLSFSKITRVIKSSSIYQVKSYLSDISPEITKFRKGIEEIMYWNCSKNISVEISRHFFNYFYVSYLKSTYQESKKVT